MKSTRIKTWLLSTVFLAVGFAMSVIAFPRDAEARGFSAGRSSFSSSSFSRSSYGTMSSSRYTYGSSSRSSFSTRSSIATPRPSVPAAPAKKVYPRPTYQKVPYRYTPSTPKPVYVQNNTGWYAFTALAAYMALSDDDRDDAPKPDTKALATMTYQELAQVICADDVITKAELAILKEWRRVTGKER